MATIELRVNDRELEAELTAGLRVIVRERDVAEVAYSLSVGPTRPMASNCGTNHDKHEALELR